NQTTSSSDKETSLVTMKQNILSVLIHLYNNAIFSKLADNKSNVSIKFKGQVISYILCHFGLLMSTG
ncbi:hypothetical protein, partial [Microcystis aeruginosa]|uniref:hypothetical protein n=1 Tax=Microcystis aeruginosa TaxID=1126 RepID=UPI001C402B7D